MALHAVKNQEGVKFQSPHDGSELMLTPEKSIELQNIIGSDIMMQLDDVVSRYASSLSSHPCGGVGLESSSRLLAF